MERRKAITTAATASLTLLAGAAGIVLNSGLVGTSAAGTVGQISPVDTTSPPVTVYIDEPAPTPPATTPPTTAPLALPTQPPPAAVTPIEPSAAGSYRDDGLTEREREDEEREEPDEPHELEGAEDDD